MHGWWKLGVGATLPDAKGIIRKAIQKLSGRCISELRKGTKLHNPCSFEDLRRATLSGPKSKSDRMSLKADSL